jgi:hypothetical protein
MIILVLIITLVIQIEGAPYSDANLRELIVNDFKYKCFMKVHSVINRCTALSVET